MSTVNDIIDDIKKIQPDNDVVSPVNNLEDDINTTSSVAMYQVEGGMSAASSVSMYQCEVGFNVPMDNWPSCLQQRKGHATLDLKWP